jgi:hypothetical protein
MKFYRSENRLTIDNCAQLTKELQNKSVEDRHLMNFYYTNDCKCEVLDDFLFDNNMVVKDGYGFTNGCSVDVDSELRMGAALTHDREKIQLCSRWDVGGPNINKGGLIPNIESRLKNAEDTSYIRDCDKITEHDYNRWTPLVGCLAPTIQNPDYIVEPWVRGGAHTRNDVRTNTYLEKCGFENNGKNWVRKETTPIPL